MQYKNMKELMENLGCIPFNGKRVMGFCLSNGSPPKDIKEELDLDSREDVLALKAIQVFASDKHVPNVVKFFK